MGVLGEYGNGHKLKGTVASLKCFFCSTSDPQQGEWLEAFLYEAAHNFDLFSNIQDQN